MSLFTREGGMAARKTLALVAALGLLIFTPVPVNAAPQAPRPANATATENTALTAETEEAAIALAASSGERVEVLAFRDEQREVYANPDGTLTAEEHTEPVRAMLDILVEGGMEGKDLAQVVEEATREYQDLPLARTPIALAGGPAVIVEGLPGRAGTRQVFAIHGDRLYRLIFATFDPAFPEVEGDMQELWDAGMETFVFLEGGT